MTDDQGWGQTGYYHHPILKTPHLDEMAQNGIRMDRFYAGSPVCSPTRATVLTGRTGDRTGVYSHGQPLRNQEITIAHILKELGYKTCHLGKWHLSGIKGPGVPILESNNKNPGNFGFDEWISVTNFFDINPLMSQNGKISEYKGSSTQVIVEEAIKFIEKSENDPFFLLIWTGSPHYPWKAIANDKANLPTNLKKNERDYLGEIIEIDNGLGLLRKELKNRGIASNTLLWFNSDNGGLKEGKKEGVGNLNGFKGSVYEGGIRVPCIIEWPERINPGKVSSFPASTLDILPTILSLLNISSDSLPHPLDGKDISQVFSDERKNRDDPIPIKFLNAGALIDNNLKLLVEDIEKKVYRLYNLEEDKGEENDLLPNHIEKGREMIEFYEDWLLSVTKSTNGEDYGETTSEVDYRSRFWKDDPSYQPHLTSWKNRPEYYSFLKTGFLSFLSKTQLIGASIISILIAIAIVLKKKIA